MGKVTKIEWCHHTFNPWRGCSKVSPGCQACYADAQARRNPGVLGIWGAQGTRVVASESMWREPIRWNAEAAAAGERRRVFCASMCDVFEDWQGFMVNAAGHRLYRDGADWHTEGAPCPVLTMDDVRLRLFELIAMTPALDWLLLTKRPANILPALDRLRGMGLVASDHLPWDNVWLGTSVEDQQRADERIPELLKVPARVRFLSCEPLLGLVDLTAVQTSSQWPGKREPSKLDALRGFTYSRRKPFVLGGITEEKGEVPYVDLHDVGRIGWVIVGGESGPQARFCDVDWVRSLVRQCQAAAVPVFVKQLGARPVSSEPKEAQALVRCVDDPKGGEPSEWPEDLRVREVPEVQL